MNVFHPQVLANYVSFGFEPTEIGDVHLRCLPETEGETFTMGGSHDTFNQAGDIACPVVVVAGVDDALGPASIAPDLAQQFPIGSLQQYNQLSHFGPLQDPELLGESVQRTVSQLHKQ